MIVSSKLLILLENSWWAVLGSNQWPELQDPRQTRLLAATPSIKRHFI
jgi:hypothetical protein